MAKVWAQFDSAGPLIGRPWPITYRGSDEERVAQLRALGVRRFSALPYAHRPGVAGYLNDWAAEFAAAPGVPALRDVLPRARGGDVRRRRSTPAWRSSRCTCRSATSTSPTRCWTRCGGMLADAGTPVVVHAGSGPVPERAHGPARCSRCCAGTPG